MKKWIAAALAVLLVAGCLSACGKTDVGGLGTDDRLSASDAQSPSGGDGQPSGSTPSENAPTEPSSESGSQSGGLVLEAYTGDGFSMLAPQGWRVATGGDGVNFYFIMADPQNDDRMVFHFGRLEPFLKSEEARQSWQYWDPRTGDGTLYFSKAPVCMEKTAKGLIDCWDECISFQDYLGAVLFPQFNNRTVLSCDSYAGSLAAAGQDQTVAVASGTTASGRNAYLTLSAAIFDPGYLDIFEEGIDTYYMIAYEVNGIVMPQNCPEDVAKSLAMCLSSLQFTQEFVDRAHRQSDEQLAGVLQRSAENEALMDAILRKWGY